MHETRPRTTPAPTTPQPLHRPVLTVLAATALALAGLAVLIPNLPFAPALSDAESQVRSYFDLATESNLWSWFNVGVLGLAGLAQAAAGALARLQGRRVAWAWWGSAVVCLGLSVDDMTSLHERLDPLGRQIGGGTGLATAAWVVPGLAFALVLVVAVLLLARRLSPVPRRLLLGGLALFLGAAFGLEAMGNAVLEQQGPSRLYAVFLHTEELLEAWGAAALAAAPFAAVLVGRSADGVRLVYRG